MPLNESTRKSRRRFPVEFDLEGVPQDSTIRQQLLEQKQQELTEQNEMPSVKQVSNFFAVDKAQSPQVIDINNPGGPRYGSPQNPHRHYPKVVYNHETGKVLEVKNQAQYEAAQRRGFEDSPDPKRDYHNVRSGMTAQPKKEVEPREHVMTAEELEEMETQELAALNEEENQQSAEEADAEIAAQLGETEATAPKAKSKRKK